MSAITKTKIDIFTVIYYVLLVGCGWLSIYIADFHGDSIGFRHANQQLWIGISFAVALIILFIDKRFFFDFAYHYYFLLILVLVLVILFGQEINGAKAWFQIGGFKIQPAEFAKITTGLALAKYLDAEEHAFQHLKTTIISLSIVAIPLGIVVLQNDMGSALVYCSFFIPLYRQGFSPVLFFIALIALLVTITTLKWGTPIVIGVSVLIATFTLLLLLPKQRKKQVLLLLIPIGLYLLAFFVYSKSYLLYSFALYIILFVLVAFQFRERTITDESIKKVITYISLIVIAALSFSVSYLFDTLLQRHQKERILQVIGQAQESYNVMHSKIAIALGGFSGQGFLKGTHTKLSYVPEQETDFIFTTVCETYGFLGSTFIILLFFLFMMRLITLAERQTATFSRVYAYGVVGIFFFHFMINVGMVIGLLPVIGIPLPFFSYGGSSLLAFTILLFILVKLDTRREDRVI